jgi:hypothetical protein
MARFIIIDQNSGYIYGDTGDLNGPARDETPSDACRRLDIHIAGSDAAECDYVEHGPNYQPAFNEHAYHVFRADIDGSEAIPLVADGQDQATIETVERDCRKVAVVTAG